MRLKADETGGKRKIQIFGRLKAGKNFFFWGVGKDFSWGWVIFFGREAARGIRAFTVQPPLNPPLDKGGLVYRVACSDWRSYGAECIPRWPGQRMPDPTGEASA